MLLAEIHGKRLPEVEGQEDWLTSAVFGHLRFVAPGTFWPSLFRRAKTVGVPQNTLQGAMTDVGLSWGTYTHLETSFWPNCGRFGEPDLLLRFTGEDVTALIVLIEVKLNAGKSNRGEDDDQLARYLELLDDADTLPAWKNPASHRYLVYLTQTYAKLELEGSVMASHNGAAIQRMFGLEWRDILEVATEEANGNLYLTEVGNFLRGRGFEAFNGMRYSSQLMALPSGKFYQSKYFELRAELPTLVTEFDGGFYDD